ncbi:MAG: TetR/AcrR family transcriptional regulator [Methanomicrobiales archaeon]|nr:TetR/AcrR family transcriptional regulator [Methanomicrobiales archaeon]
MPDPPAGKQDVIFDTALRLFVERGFFGTPTSLISREAGIATGTLFFYFKTKEDLIDALYLRVKAEAAEAMNRGLDQETDAKAKLNRLGKNAVLFGLEHPEKMKFMEQFAHTPFISKSAREEGISRFFFLKDLIVQGIQEGQIRNLDPELLIFMMASSFSGLIARVGTATSPKEREIFVEQGLEFIWNGLAKKSSREPDRRKKTREYM